MLLALGAIVLGFVLLIWSADRFIEGAATTARQIGIPPLVIGMLIVGFGTSAPEMVVSALAALDGNPGLALGNGYGSNIVNISLILGITAIIAPIEVHSKVIRKELPLLILLCLGSGWLLLDRELSRADAMLLLAGFFVLIGWSVYTGLRDKDDSLSKEIEAELQLQAMSTKMALFWLVAGLLLLILSSRILVMGAVSIAEQLGVSDLIVGLTIVALGTSLPELASSVIAARKGEHDIALGNVIGSNMFNLLAVVGIAGIIAPLQVEAAVLYRDWPVMFGLTLMLFAMAFGFHRQRRINRYEGAVLLLVYFVYNGYLLHVVMRGG